MQQDDLKKFKRVAADIAKQMADVKEAQERISEAVSAAAEKFQLQKSTVRGAAQRMNMTEAQRIALQSRDSELDQLITELGMLADMPLGEAAIEAEAEKEGKPAPKAKSQAVAKPKKPKAVIAQKYDVAEPAFN